MENFIFCIVLPAKWEYYSKGNHFLKLTLREKNPYSELFWSAFSCIRTEYGEILSISSYSVQMRENADQTGTLFAQSDIQPNFHVKVDEVVV